MKELYPTAPFISKNSRLKEWMIAGVLIGRKVKIRRPNGRRIHWMVSKWSNVGCWLTYGYCKKWSFKVWGLTEVGRLDLSLWRIMHERLPIRYWTSRWGDGNPFCPWCKRKRETHIICGNAPLANGWPAGHLIRLWNNGTILGLPVHKSTAWYNVTSTSIAIPSWTPFPTSMVPPIIGHWLADVSPCN